PVADALPVLTRPGSPDIDADLARFCSAYGPGDAINGFPLVVLVDDSDFTARSLNNFVWVTFTRSNPAADVGGIGAFVAQKHWGCEGAVVIDARIKPHHAPPLIEDPAVSQRGYALGAADGCTGSSDPTQPAEEERQVSDLVGWSVDAFAAMWVRSRAFWLAKGTGF